MQGFSGGKFCKSDESRLSWAAGVRPRAVRSGRRWAEATWRGWQGHGRTQVGRRPGPQPNCARRQGRGAPGANVTQTGYAWEINAQSGKRSYSSERALQSCRSKNCTRGQRNTSGSPDEHFSAPS